MADPTAANRKSVVSAVRKVVPSGTPLGASLDADRKAEEDQLAADEANNLVEQRSAVALPKEAAAFVNPETRAQPVAQPSQAFVNPAAPASDSPEIAVAAALAPGSAPSMSPPALPDSSSGNAAIDAYGKESQDTSAQLEKLNQDRAAAIQKRLEEDEKGVEQIDPKTFFEGKNTWQKVLGGIGMFLGSITPEGAKNVASIVEKEINRDIETQKMNIRLRQDKKDSTYSKMLQKYGSEEAALLAKKKGAFDLMDLQLKKLELNSRNTETRARLTMGREELNLKREALGNELKVALLKQSQEAGKASLPGYEGTNQNPAIIKDATERMAAKKSADNAINNLEELLKKGSLAPMSSNRAQAKQVRENLAADIAKALFGRSSDSELEVARNLIPDITSMTQSGKVDKDLLSNLKKKLASDLDAHLSSAGFRKPSVYGAREIK